MQEHFIRQLHRAIDSLYLNMVGWTLYFKLVTLVTSCQVHHRVCVTMFYSFSFLIFRCQRTLSSDHNYLTTSMHKTVNLFVLRNLFLFCVVGRAYGVGEIPKTQMGMGTGNVKGRPMTGMSTFLHRQAKSIMDHNWQLIQVKMINLRSCCCLLLLFVIVICYCYCYCYCYLFVVVVVVVVVVCYCYLFLVCCRRHG